MRVPESPSSHASWSVLRRSGLVLAALVVTASVVLPLGAFAGPPPSLEAGPSLSTGRQATRAARLDDGRLIVFGGHGAGFVSLATAEIWSPVDNAFTQVSMNFTHDTPCFTRLEDGRFLLAGGAANLGIPQYATSEIYDPADGSFTPVGNMIRFRAGGGAVQLAGGRVLIAGAWWTHNDAHTYGELLDLGTGQFAATGPLGTPRAYPVVVALADGDALVLGGSGPNGQDIGGRVERYRSASNGFVPVSDQLFEGESGWRTFEHPRPQADQRLADGRYVYLAWRAAGSYTEYRLLTVDPVTGTIGRLVTEPALPDSREASLLYPVPNSDRTRVLLPAVRTGVSPAAYFAMSLEVAGGTLAVPDAALDGAPGYLMDGTVHVTPDDRLLVVGGSTQPDNFSAVNRTSFLRPATVQAPLSVDIALVAPGTGNALVELSWPQAFGPLEVEAIGELGGTQWMPVAGDSRVADGRVIFGIPLDAGVPQRFFRVRTP